MIFYYCCSICFIVIVVALCVLCLFAYDDQCFLMSLNMDMQLSSDNTIISHFRRYLNLPCLKLYFMVICCRCNKHKKV